MKNIKIPEVKFNLKDPKKNSIIIAIFRYNNKRFRFSTSHNIDPKHWSTKKQRPITTYKHYLEVNDYLNNLSNVIIETFKSDQDILGENFKKTILVKLDLENVETETFLEYLDYFIKTTTMEKRTKQKYEGIGLLIGRFSPCLTFDQITMQWRDEYIKWRYDNTPARSQNTINKDLSLIIKVVKRAIKEGRTTNKTVIDEDFNVKEVKTGVFALTEADLKLLEDCKFDNVRLERVVDWFLLACYTAFRWSDFSNLKPEHIIKDGDDMYITKFTYKGNKSVYIPLTSKAKSLLEKYEYRSIDISEQKFNEYIKEAAEIAGLTDTIIMSENVRGRNIDVTYRKCEKISTHCGRRTWATINYLKGYPIGLLMQVTGHTVQKTFLGYVGASNLLMAKELRKLMGL